MNMPYPARTKTPSPHPSIFLQFPPAFLCMVLHTCAGSVPCLRAFAFASLARRPATLLKVIGCSNLRGGDGELVTNKNLTYGSN